MSENDWKAYVERWKIANQAEREMTRREGPSPEQAISWCLESLCIFEAMHGDPFVKDPVTRKKEEEARRHWAQLRERWTA